MRNVTYTKIKPPKIVTAILVLPENLNLPYKIICNNKFVDCCYNLKNLIHDSKPKKYFNENYTYAPSEIYDLYHQQNDSDSSLDSQNSKIYTPSSEDCQVSSDNESRRRKGFRPLVGYKVRSWI